ncbi:MAG: hypothetical protein VST67_03750 [Nitrospirota bacterium]|nr:hypothetical protein [Nitrospirota bacterium]
MTTTLQPEWDIPDAFWKWALLAMVPAILAAGAMEPSAPSIVLPDAQSYKTPLSDTLFESSEWRRPAQPEAAWRQPRSPSLGWRTETPPQPSQPQRKIHLFPRYQPGNPFDYDHIDREEKPQIKVFEFGS